MSSTNKRGLFMDLDSTIIRTKSKKEFAENITDWEFIPGVLKAIKEYIEDSVLIIVSNQGGISLGYLTEDDFNNKMSVISKAMLDIIGIKPLYYFSRSDDKSDPMRKPNIGMATAAEADYGIVIAESDMVGDMATDMQFAINAGMRGFCWAWNFCKSDFDFNHIKKYKS
jgi:histidinol-phosphate phosphatase family protein